MRALVTGATGFLGSHLVRCLLAHDDGVAVLLRPDSNCWRLDEFAGRLRFLHSSSQSFSDITREVSEFAPDVLFHLAWAGVHGRERNDARHVSPNLCLTESAVRLALLAGCSAVVGVGTQAEYGPCASVIDESTPPRPTTAYGSSKLAAGRLLLAATSAQGERGVWLRLVSAYGPMDEPSYLIPYLVTELLAGRSPVLSSGEQPHDTLFCADAADALRAAATNPACRGTYVLAAGSDTSVREIAELARDLLAPGLELGFGPNAGHPGWRGSHRKLSADTGWSPSTLLASGLSETALWYRRNATVS